jgi:hypothetical protein
MAQSRRRRENDTFTDMAEALPIQENAKDLDKASILRVAINYLKLRDLVGENEPEESGDAAEKDGVAENGGATVKTEDSESEVGGSGAYIRQCKFSRKRVRVVLCVCVNVLSFCHVQKTLQKRRNHQPNCPTLPKTCFR